MHCLGVELDFSSERALSGGRLPQANPLKLGSEVSRSQDWG